MAAAGNALLDAADGKVLETQLRAATVAVPGTMSAADKVALNLLAAEYAAGLDLRSQQIRALKAFAGITTPVTVCFDDFTTTGINSKPFGENTTSGTGTSGVIPGTQSALQLSSGATAGGMAYCCPTTGPLFQTYPAAARWGYSARFAVTTAVNAATVARAGLHDMTVNAIMAGVIGPISTVNYSALVGTATIDSGVPIDTNPHTFVLYRATGNVYLEIDGVARGNVAFAGAWAAMPVVCHYITNGATAATRTMVMRWLCAIAETL